MFLHTNIPWKSKTKQGMFLRMIHGFRIPDATNGQSLVFGLPGYIDMIYIYIHTNTHIYTYKHTHTYIYIHTNTYIYIYTNIYIYVHTQTSIYQICLFNLHKQGTGGQIEASRLRHLIFPTIAVVSLGGSLTISCNLFLGFFRISVFINLNKKAMNIRTNGCFLKWWYPHFTPQNDHF